MKWKLIRRIILFIVVGVVFVAAAHAQDATAQKVEKLFGEAFNLILGGLLALIVYYVKKLDDRGEKLSDARHEMRGELREINVKLGHLSNLFDIHQRTLDNLSNTYTTKEETKNHVENLHSLVKARITATHGVDYGRTNHNS